MDSNRPKRKYVKAPLPVTGVGNPVGRPSKYRPDLPDMLIEHMANGESFWSFAAVIRVCFQTLHQWTDKASPYYHEEFLEAKKTGEALLLRHDEHIGREGMQGKLQFTKIKKEDPDTGEVIEQFMPATFNATTYIFTMKNRYPTLYRDRIENVHTDADGKPVAPVQVTIRLPDNGRARPEPGQIPVDEDRHEDES